MRIRTLLLAVALMGAGCGGGGNGGAVGASIEVEAGDLYFEPTSLSASAGEIEVTLDNVGSAEHDFVIEEIGDEEVVHAAAGETATGTVELDAGTYTFYCSVPGHREAGMEGALTVE